MRRGFASVDEPGSVDARRMNGRGSSPTRAVVRLSVVLGLALTLSMLGGGRAAAQTTVGRDVRVHATPDSAARIVGRVAKGTTLTVLGPDSLRNRYLHVRTPSATGWVWAPYIKRGAPVEGADSTTAAHPRRSRRSRVPSPDTSAAVDRPGAPTQPRRPTPSSSPTPSNPGPAPTPRSLPGPSNPPSAAASTGPRWEVQPSWAAPPPVVSTIQTSVGACAAGGAGRGGAAARDTFTNARKNRTDAPARVHHVSFQGLVGLWAPAGHHRSFQTFSPGQRDSLLMFAGRGVQVEGYLADVKPEKDEQTNCGARDSTEVDWHMYLVEHPADSLRRAVIVEATPRVRPAHRWTLKALQAVRRRERVRITGWLLFDPEHFDAVDGYVSASGKPAANPWRATLWELHPVTRIEVCRAGRWTDLDGGPPGEACAP